MPSRTHAHIEDFTSKAITDGTANLCPYHCHGCLEDEINCILLFITESPTKRLYGAQQKYNHVFGTCGVRYRLFAQPVQSISRRPHYYTDKKIKDDIFHAGARNAYERRDRIPATNRRQKKPKQCYIETWTLQSFSIYLIRRHYLEYTPYLNLAVHRGT